MPIFWAKGTIKYSLLCSHPQPLHVHNQLSSVAAFLEEGGVWLLFPTSFIPSQICWLWIRVWGRVRRKAVSSWGDLLGLFPESLKYALPLPIAEGFSPVVLLTGGNASLPADTYGSFFNPWNSRTPLLPSGRHLIPAGVQDVRQPHTCSQARPLSAPQDTLSLPRKTLKVQSTPRQQLSLLHSIPPAMASQSLPLGIL